MRLENLYTNFAHLQPDEQTAYIAAYRLRRAQDLEMTPPSKKKATSTKERIELSEEEKAVMKMLGLKPKDVIALRAAAMETEPEEEGDPGDLFKDSTFDEEDENA